MNGCSISRARLTGSLLRASISGSTEAFIEGQSHWNKRSSNCLARRAGGRSTMKLGDESDPLARSCLPARPSCLAPSERGCHRGRKRGWPWKKDDSFSLAEPGAASFSRFDVGWLAWLVRQRLTRSTREFHLASKRERNASTQVSHGVPAGAALLVSTRTRRAACVSAPSADLGAAGVCVQPPGLPRRQWISYFQFVGIL